MDIINKIKSNNQINFTKVEIAKLFQEFYDRIKDKDQDHKKWLLDEVTKFVQEKLYNE